MKHVMVVDDEVDILTCLDEALSAEGYRVTAVASGAEALDLLAREVPDLIILDLRMPQISGIEVLKELRAKHPELPIVVCTGLSGYRDDFEVVTSNVAAFLEKPLDIERVVRTVRELLGPAGPPPQSAEDQRRQPNA